MGHGLRRLVLIGSDGFITLEAFRWISDVGASFVMLDRTGKVLTVTGPVAPSDAKLRRAQALAVINGTALKISKELISQKLAGQESLVRDMLHDSVAAEAIGIIPAWGSIFCAVGVLHGEGRRFLCADDELTPGETGGRGLRKGDAHRSTGGQTILALVGGS